MEEPIGGRACLVSHRLGGLDGVSVEAAKWEAALLGLSWQVTRAAGFFADHRANDVAVRGMWADRPGGEPPPVDQPTITQLVTSNDLLILDNAGSLWSAPSASLAWERSALAAGVATIVRHHDPAWQGAPLRRITDQSVPLHDVRHLHVVINELTYREFATRWPPLAAADALRLVHNRVDVTSLPRGDREGTRRVLGVRPEEVLVVHPARVEGGTKNIPGAVDFVRALADRMGRPVRYWLTDGAGRPSPLVKSALDRAPGLIRRNVPRQADLYAACDLVVLPSTWEGWGLPVVEAAAAGKPVVAGPYPVLDEIRGAGLSVLDPSEIDGAAELLTAGSATELLGRNQLVVRQRFDLRFLPDTLAELARHATELIRTPRAP